MSSPFVAEIRMFGFNFAPKGWAFCDGQLLPISQNTALFSLLGTFYGGDGKSTFALPDFQGSVAMSQGQSTTGSQYFLGQVSGTPTVTLLQTEMPAHNHIPVASNAGGGTLAPAPNETWAGDAGRNPAPRFNTAQNVTMSPFATGITGSSFPHNNMQPYLCVNFCIAMQGIFPPRS